MSIYKSIGQRRGRHKRLDRLAARPYEMMIANGTLCLLRGFLADAKPKAMRMFDEGQGARRVAWVLGITRAKAIEWGLEHERMRTWERKSNPYQNEKGKAA